VYRPERGEKKEFWFISPSLMKRLLQISVFLVEHSYKFPNRQNLFPLRKGGYGVVIKQFTQLNNPLSPPFSRGRLALASQNTEAIILNCNSLFIREGDKGGCLKLKNIESFDKLSNGLKRTGTSV